MFTALCLVEPLTDLLAGLELRHILFAYVDLREALIQGTPAEFRASDHPKVRAFLERDFADATLPD